MRLEKVGITTLIGAAVAMAVAAGIPALLPGLPLPGVVLALGIGTLIGPQVLVHPGVTLNFLADCRLGTLFLMAGFEMDPAVLLARPLRNALLGCVLTAVIVVGASTVLSLANVVDAPILTALALSTTSISAVMPLLRDGGLLGPPYGPIVLAAGLSHDRHRLAVALASISEQIRGYGHVKQAHLDKAMKR